jgi:hypothetical protein
MADAETDPDLLQTMTADLTPRAAVDGTLLGTVGCRDVPQAMEPLSVTGGPGCCHFARHRFPKAAKQNLPSPSILGTLCARQNTLLYQTLCLDRLAVLRGMIDRPPFPRKTALAK